MDEERATQHRHQPRSKETNKINGHLCVNFSQFTLSALAVCLLCVCVILHNPRQTNPLALHKAAQTYSSKCKAIILIPTSGHVLSWGHEYLIFGTLLSGSTVKKIEHWTKMKSNQDKQLKQSIVGHIQIEINIDKTLTAVLGRNKWNSSDPEEMRSKHKIFSADTQTAFKNTSVSEALVSSWHNALMGQFGQCLLPFLQCSCSMEQLHSDLMRAGMV